MWLQSVRSRKDVTKAQEASEFDEGNDRLDAAHKGFVLLNIPFVHVCVETFTLFLLINNFERRVLRIERTTVLYILDRGPVLCKTITHFSVLYY